MKQDIQSLVSRKDHIERKIYDFEILTYANAALEEEVSRPATKVLDLEE